MRPAQGAMLCGLAFFGWLSASSARAADAPSDCDKLAGSPTDPQRVSEGVGPYGVDPDVAIPACEKAVNESPDNARFRYQLGRAYAARAAQDHLDATWKFTTDNYAAAADAGYPHAKIALAAFRWFGKGGIAQDPAAALALIDQATVVDAGPAKRQRRLMFESAVRAPPDSALRKFVDDAAAKGDSDALYALGLSAEEELFAHDDLSPDKTAVHYIKASQAGSGAAAMALLRLYGRGRIVGADPSAQSLIKIAVDGVDPRALYDAAMTYALGVDGVAKDEATAAQLLKRAVAGGDPAAARELSAFYAVGKGGLPIDKPESKRLERLAADEGDEDAVLLIAGDIQAGSMSGGAVDGAQSTKADAVAFLKRAARWSAKAKAKLKEMVDGG